jgi:hypothetical protein
MILLRSGCDRPVVEIHGRELDLAAVQEVMFRFGRAYPPYWDRNAITQWT